MKLVLRKLCLFICFIPVSLCLLSQENSDVSFFKAHLQPEIEKKSQTKSLEDKNALQTSGSFLLGIYQNLISSQDNHTCVFHPTCSSYCRQAISHHGLIAGGIMTFDRLSRCHGLSPEKYGVDILRRKLIDNVD